MIMRRSSKRKRPRRRPKKSLQTRKSPRRINRMEKTQETETRQRVLKRETR